MTRYRTVAIDGLDIFYREAGSRSSPTILLLHGYPSSSHMFRKKRIVISQSLPIN